MRWASCPILWCRQDICTTTNFGIFFYLEISNKSVDILRRQF
ncbi:hypothetical protein FDUTEX481_00056 [Tolypothrix sp. PCC 7601]|nr:hypothetical protein FDUTEX481_00056 [Tolypothrix sp. PCC 7601]